MGSVYCLTLLIVITLTMMSVMVSSEKSPKPNIVLLVLDDMGWDDVSFHGSNQIATPNIDLLAYSGVALERYYSHCVCTPSRSALLSGKYAHTMGMQGYPSTNGEARGLPLTEKLLPQYLKELGYSTHLVGKWHLGHYKTEYLPTSRGFDSHFGHRGGFIDYYEYLNEEYWDSGTVAGFDLYRNSTPAWDVEGYLTDVYNDEAKSIIMSHEDSSPLFLMVAHNAPHGANAPALLQAPPEIVREMRHVELPERRLFAATMKKLDDSIGDIVEALSNKGIINNTIIVLIADNGGMTSGLSINYASNYPLRGLKFSPQEGGVRVAGLIWTPTVDVINHLWSGYMHVSDWLPTLLSASGSKPPENIDGLDLWESIVTNSASRREEFFEVDDYSGFMTVTSGDYKLITGNVSVTYSDFQGGYLRGIIGQEPSYINAIENSKVYKVLDKMGKPLQASDIDLRDRIRISCNNSVSDENLCNIGDGRVCLYNIKEDPCELNDISSRHPEVVKRLQARLDSEQERVIPRIALYRNPRALPKFHNFTWATWDEE